MEKALSCGFIIFDKKTEKMLACHPTGKPFKNGYFDIPKGHIEEGETPLECAKRELFEETGLKILSEKVNIIGKRQYTAYKDLYVFWTEMDIDTKTPHCDSYFEMDGKTMKEISSYILTDDVETYYRSLRPIIQEVIDEREREK